MNSGADAVPTADHIFGPRSFDHDIRHTPAVVERKGDLLQVTEHVIRRKGQPT